MINLKKSIATALVALATLTSTVLAPVTLAYAEEAEGGESAPSSHAVTMRVSPVSNRVLLRAGTELTYIFTVSNDSAEDFNFRVYAVPYSVTNESYDISFSNETSRTQISRWISFRKNDTEDEFKNEVKLDAPAGGTQKVEYKIKVPENIPSGGQYASIVIEYVPANGESTSSGLQTIPRVNMLIYGSTTGDTKDEAKIAEHDLPGFITDGNVGITSRIENNGNTDFSATYEFTVDNFFGGRLYESNVSYDVLPDTARRVNSEWEGTPAFGIFRVTSTITALDQTSTQSKIVLKVPIFIIIILIIVLTALVVWIIILIKKRQAQKSRVVA